MSRRQKIVIIAVFVLMALLYTGAVANGGGSGQGDASQRHPGGIVGWLGDVVGDPPTADRGDLSAPCLVDSTFTVKGSCVLTVAKSDEDTRRVRLHATDPVTISTRAPNSDETINVDVKADADVSVTVDGDGAPVTIACASADDTCTVTLS